MRSGRESTLTQLNLHVVGTTYFLQKLLHTPEQLECFSPQVATATIAITTYVATTYVTTTTVAVTASSITLRGLDQLDM